MSIPADPSTLPLFPLQSVLFPEGLLGLKVFEARYLDLIGECLRESKPFGVVALQRGQEVRREGEPVEFESVGCEAQLLEVDSAQAGILHVRCRGGQRFSVVESRQSPGGLWIADVEYLEPDETVLPTEDLLGSAKGLANAIQVMKRRNQAPFLEPYRFEDAGWIANRWCEILPIPLAARQKLMELPDPLVRLQLVDQFLRQKGILQD